MPVRSAEEEVDWERAKGIVRKQYPGKEVEDVDGFYALTMTVYKRIRAGHDGESGVEEARGRVWERLEHAMKRMGIGLRERFVGVGGVRIGDTVVVMTVLGRGLVEGVVQSIASDGVVVLVPQGGGHIESVYSGDIFRFTVRALTEASVKDWGLRECGEDEFDIPLVPHHGDIVPEYEVLMRAIGWMDQRAAAIFWQRVLKRGYEEVALEYGLSGDIRDRVREALRGLGLIGVVA